MNKINKTSKTPGELFKESGKHYVNAGKDLLKFTGNTIIGTYKAIEATDKAIGKIGKPSTNKIITFTRNNLIKALIVGSIIYGGFKVANPIQDKKIDKQEETIKEKGNSKELMHVYTGNYPDFQNKKITKSAPLTKYYLGLDLSDTKDIVTGDTLVLNPSKTLHDLRTKKISQYGSKSIKELDKINIDKMSNEEQADFRIKYPIDATYLFIVRPYIDGNVKKTQLSMKQFITLTENIIRKTEIDIEPYDGKLNPKQKTLLDIIKKDISGESIVAYAMTELCENKEGGESNKQLFDMLLQNAGVEFLALTPAIYDNKTSYGLYQFTEYALYDTPNEKRGASVVNKYIKDKNNKLPGSVIDLNTRELQTKAAYLFAVHNFAMALSKLNEKDATSLLAYYQKNSDSFMRNITELIAMCHHRPADNIALKLWIQDNFKNNIYTYGKAQTYGKASKVNYEALK